MWGRYFSVYYSGEDFTMFSKPHLVSLFIILIVAILSYTFSQRVKLWKNEKLLRYALSFSLIATELSFQVWCLIKNIWTPEYNLPFHLCSASTILCAIMLFKNNYKVYKLTYFWGLFGAMQALITPDLSGYNYPHYVFFKFFILHGLIIISVLYVTFINDFKLSFNDVLNAFYITNLFAIFVIPVNVLTKGNYLFLCRKPEVATILNFFDSWPWYIIFLEIIVFLAYFILYLPFIINKRIVNVIDKEYE